VTPGNHSRNSSTRAPSSRFSNNALTGPRAPLKSHTPPTLPATRSTSGQRLRANPGERLERRRTAVCRRVNRSTSPGVRLQRHRPAAVHRGVAAGGSCRQVDHPPRVRL
jgi:hypothetical protein